jgi:hypothetical protein
MASVRRLVTRILFLALVLTTLGAGNAFADKQYLEGVSDGCSFTMDPDVCFSSPMSGWVGGYFTSCQAYGVFGGKCYDVVTTFRTDGTQSKACALVTNTAHCACNPTTFATKGICTWAQR